MIKMEESVTAKAIGFALDPWEAEKAAAWLTWTCLYWSPVVPPKSPGEWVTGWVWAPPGT